MLGLLLISLIPHTTSISSSSCKAAGSIAQAQAAVVNLLHSTLRDCCWAVACSSCTAPADCYEKQHGYTTLSIASTTRIAFLHTLEQD
jgi:hypothetical protein